MLIRHNRVLATRNVQGTVRYDNFYFQVLPHLT